MCTVSFIARRGGYLLGMNRDEKLSRVKGLSPEFSSVNGRKILCPSEPGGGTWIALNETGATLALINWYSITARVQTSPSSRGEIVKTTAFASNPGEAEGALKNLPLVRTNPFRLIGIFPVGREIVEWQWNLKTLVRRDHGWRTHQWISSGFDELLAQRVRSKTFREASCLCSAGRLEWLRRLHRSHSPERGPFSTCMHRADAATVSYTEIVVSSRRAVMRHCVSAPCESRRFSTDQFDFPLTNPAVAAH